MNYKQGGIMVNTHRAQDKTWRPLCAHIGIALFLFVFQIASVKAGELALSGLDFATQSGDKLQIEMEMTGPAITPQIFKTDNPARIALDFPGVKSALAKKMYPIKQGAASSVYVVEAAGRVRVVVNLIEATPFETKVVGNKVRLILTRAKAVMPAKSAMPATPVPAKAANSVVAALIPAQDISGFDFKRGDKGEGRILVSLANPNTIVNSKEQGGKVIISFLNTRLPESLAKRLDVSEFATPVKFIDTVSSDRQTTITVAMQNELYDYSVFQADGLLTVEFRPLSNEEKDALDRSRTKYTGDRLSLNFQEIEIRSVIAILAEFTGQNVVAGDDVTGTITLKLDDVPWDEALDFIMMTKDLGKYETGNVTLISPLDKIKDYKKKQQETDKVVEQLDPLVTEYIKINYAKAENFRNLLNGQDTGAFGSCGVTGTTGTASSGGSSTSATSAGGSSGAGSASQGQGAGASGTEGGNDKFGLLSPRGSAVVDARTNTLIVRETTKRLDEVKKLIRKLDVPVRQVMIEARVVIADDSFTENLGVKFGVAKQNADIGGGKSFAIGGTGTQGNTTTGAGTPTNMLVDLGVAGLTATPPGALGMTLARGADYVLNLELQALQIEGKGEIVSNPRVMTMDRCTAVMMQGVQIPVTTPGTANTPPTTTYIDAVLKLNATPQITPSGSVIMNLLITKDNANTTSNPVSGNPGIDKREIKTSVLVEDGETVVLGGVYEGAESYGKNKIPFFADLPGIGFLFTNSTTNKTKKELLIFVTPKIMKDNVASD
ncbi:type IV pilus secretin family protein [Methylobacter sp.]|uniref:type IV pilus secretin family protein n=1 Tax=Methylobacter sp. TaxID=2051955 RepID=UPI002487EC1C|nr:type IV pilus secretin family protein [Methylobacter sp.]MDI1277178.1 type IV pilus secretin PilQ [Methylobacter sp.]MDI1358679.1 type IV pilus secretin PilQ [Methylobacter sp.]